MPSEKTAIPCEVGCWLVDSLHAVLSPFYPASITRSALFSMTSFRQIQGVLVGRMGRAMLFAWATFLMAGFGLARSLEPDPRGYGTHRQLGLPECTFRWLFSKPCPSCGMTTCFSHFVRGEFAAAAHANETGLLLAVVATLMIPWSLGSAAQGRLWLVDDPVKVFAGMTIALGGIAVVLWSWRLWLSG